MARANPLTESAWTVALAGKVAAHGVALPEREAGREHDSNT